MRFDDATVQSNEPKTTTYTFSRKFQLSVLLYMLGFFGMAVVTIYVGIIDRDTPNPNAPLVVALALVFVTLGYYCIDIWPKIHASIEVTEEQIIQRFANGQSIAIRWRDVVRIRGRQFLGRIEIFSRESGKVIHVEAQIEGFGEIVAALVKKLRPRV